MTESICRCEEQAEKTADSTADSTDSYISRYGQFDELFIHFNKPVNLPVIEAKAEKYTPLPYVFRLPDASPVSEVHARVRCPPFYIQLDHAIAVIWTLYATEKLEIPLGINQLHWAYSFLRNVKNRGTSIHSPDVQHCLDSIADELIHQYAQLAELDTEISASSSDSSSCPAASLSGKRTCTCNSRSVRFSEETPPFWPCTSTPIKSPNQSFAPTLQYPFSPTYNDMKLHNYALREESKKKHDTCLRRGAPDWLVDLRKEQLMNILDELGRLHSIEDYLAATDDTFRRYLDEDDNELKDYILEQLSKSGCRCYCPCPYPCPCHEKGEEEEEEENEDEDADFEDEEEEDEEA